MEDLNAASLDDVKEWFRLTTAPSNAMLVVAGDIDPAEAQQKVEKYFGDIPGGPPLARHEAWIAKMTGEQRAGRPGPRPAAAPLQGLERAALRHCGR